MIGALVRTAVRSRSAIVPVTRTSVRHSGGNWVYREGIEIAPRDSRLADGIMTVAWWWLFYHLFTEPDHLLGHYLRPPASTFTDEELGIPKDDE
uniref:Putative nadh dehydrogenase ubiquinone 1 beta subcomplex subunit 2 mitochondrial n=1 Tax=Amblyomma sculptum TaxID=1581419 RepID=A0A1E1XUR5_AMBSC